MPASRLEFLAKASARASALSSGVVAREPSGLERANASIVSELIFDKSVSNCSFDCVKVVAGFLLDESQLKGV